MDVPLPVAFPRALSKLDFRIGGETCTSTAGATTVGVDHSWVGDLTFKFTSPSGTSVTLINSAGGPNNSGNNFCQTLLTATAASSIQNVTSANAPFTGNFTPAQPTSDFAGENADGVWTLNVSDSTFIDSGHIRAFSVDVSGYSCTP